MSPRTTVSSVPGLRLRSPARPAAVLLLAVCTATSRPSAWSGRWHWPGPGPRRSGTFTCGSVGDHELERVGLARPQERRRGGAHHRARIDVVAVVGGDGEVGEARACAARPSPSRRRSCSRRAPRRRCSRSCTTTVEPSSSFCAVGRALARGSCRPGAGCRCDVRRRSSKPASCRMPRGREHVAVDDVGDRHARRRPR